jgi:hypothetical protein
MQEDKKMPKKRPESLIKIRCPLEPALNKPNWAGMTDYGL